MKRLFKYLFKYDFLDNNKGIQSAIIAIVFCLMVSTPKQSVQSIGAVLFIFIVLSILLLTGFALFDKWLAKQNLNHNQLSLLNKIGWAMYCVCLIVAGYMLFWLL